MNSGEEKFGESRPPKRDEWGNNFRPPMDLMPMKFEVCGCHKQIDGHVTLTGKIEGDVPAPMDPIELFRLMASNQPVPTEKQWLPIFRVLNSYN